MVKRTFTEKKVLDIVENAVQEIYLPAVEDATPKKTGKTANAWRVVTENNTVYLMNIKFGDIVLFLEEGTKGPYIIRPKNGKALKFKIGDNTIFAKKVEHPGIEARKFVKKVLDDKGLQKRFNKIVDDGIQKILDSN